jgi:hypothetical protein
MKQKSGNEKAQEIKLENQLKTSPADYIKWKKVSELDDKVEELSHSDNNKNVKNY